MREDPNLCPFLPDAVASNKSLQAKAKAAFKKGVGERGEFKKLRVGVDII